MSDWHILTGEYPPQPGGVSDYTRQVARGLAEAGDRVHVWAPACAAPDPIDRGVQVRRVPGNFGLRALWRLWREFPDCAQIGSAQILVQYVPHAFGWKAMNVPFCLWLWSKRQNPVWVMFHEVAVPIRRGQPPLHNFLGWVNRWMARILVHSARRIWVSIPAWDSMLQGFSPGLPSAGWLPVPSGIPVIQDAEGAAGLHTRLAVRDGILVGHFGTYGEAISGMLGAALPAVLQELPGSAALLLGRGSLEFRADLIERHPGLAGRLHATGAQSPEDVSRHIGACDLMLQPYPDGVSSRRTSMVAALAHGRPVITTSGPLSEPFWQSSPAVLLASPGEIPKAVAQLAEDSDRRARMGAQAAALYQTRFDLRHTIAALRGAVDAPWVPGRVGVECESRS